MQAIPSHNALSLQFFKNASFQTEKRNLKHHALAGAVSNPTISPRFSAWSPLSTLLKSLSGKTNSETPEALKKRLEVTTSQLKNSIARALYRGASESPEENEKMQNTEIRVIGLQGDSGFTIPGEIPNISPQHCLIQRTADGKFYVKDGDLKGRPSRTGTYILHRDGSKERLTSKRWEALFLLDQVVMGPLTLPIQRPSLTKYELAQCIASLPMGSRHFTIGSGQDTDLRVLQYQLDNVQGEIWRDEEGLKYKNYSNTARLNQQRLGKSVEILLKERDELQLAALSLPIKSAKKVAKLIEKNLKLGLGHLREGEVERALQVFQNKSLLEFTPYSHFAQTGCIRFPEKGLKAVTRQTIETWQDKVCREISFSPIHKTLSTAQPFVPEDPSPVLEQFKEEKPEDWYLLQWSAAVANARAWTRLLKEALKDSGESPILSFQNKRLVQENPGLPIAEMWDTQLFLDEMGARPESPSQLSSFALPNKD